MMVWEQNKTAQGYLATTKKVFYRYSETFRFPELVLPCQQLLNMLRGTFMNVNGRRDNEKVLCVKFSPCCEHFYNHWYNLRVTMVYIRKKKK